MTTSTEALLDQVEAALDDSEALLDDGYDIDLRGLEQKITVVCGDIAALPPEKGRIYRERLEKLVAKLQAVEAALKRQQVAVVQKIDEVNLRKKATTAYKTAAGKDRKEP